jgi:FKBP-type peptidyl-prolyl cis-trans isomerase
VGGLCCGRSDPPSQTCFVACNVLADGNTSRASSRSRRSSSHQQQQQQQQSTSGAGSGAAAAAAAAVARNLAAQVSFNHEKRQGWEKPVLEDINSRRAGEGLAPVDKLTIQVRYL